MPVDRASGPSRDEATLALRALEASLLTHPAVRDCAAVRRARPDGSTSVVAYVVPEGRPTLDAIRQHAVERGSPLLPDRLVRISSLPLLDDGRVDSSALLALPVLDEATLDRVRHAAADGRLDSELVVGWDVVPPEPLRVSDILSANTTSAGRTASDPRAAEPSGPPSLSIGPAVAWPENPPRRLGDLLVRAATRCPDHTLTFLDGGAEQVMTYRDLLAQAERTMAGLRAAGMKRGDTVIFQFDRNADFILAFWACLLGGFVPAPISVPPVSDAGAPATLKLKNAWELLGHPVVLTQAELAPAFEHFRSALEMSGLRVLTIEQVRHGPAGEPHADPASDDIGLLLLTSGSTGVPKAVTQTHAALCCHAAAIQQRHGFTEHEVSLNWFPLDHVGGIVMFHLRDVGLCCHQIQVRTDYVLQEPLRWLDLIERFRATITWAPNFAFGLINDRIEERTDRVWDLSSMRFILNGGEAIVASTTRRFMKRLARYGLPATAMRPAWGMSETCSAATFAPPFSLETTSDSDEFVEVGAPNPGFEMRIVDDDNNVVPEAREGHLEVRGPCVTRGYLNNPEVNASAFTGDGWFRTGDLGRLRDGRLTITGRAKGEIIVNGVNYHAHEIEAAIESVPGVTVSFTAAFAVREPGANTDSLAVAFHTNEQSDDALVELLRRIRLTTLQRVGVAPRFLLPVSQADIPKTAIGKIQRAALTKRYAAGELDAFVQRSERLLQGTQTIPNWFFRPVWRRRAAVAHHPLDATATIVLVGDGGPVADAFAALARTAGARVVRASREKLADAVKAVASNDRLVVVADESGRTFGDDHGAAASAKAIALVQLIQGIAISRGDQASAELVVFERSARTVVAGDAADVRGAAARGILRTVPAEYPRMSVRHVDLAVPTPELAAELLVAEVADRGDELEVAYRNSERWVVRLEHRAPTPSEQGHSIGARDGFYVVTGGLGGLGVEVARQILRVSDAPVLLVGRRALEGTSDPRHEGLASLESLGTVRFHALDVADAEALESIVASAAAEWNRELAGVVHLAGVFEPRLLADENEETLNSAMHAKVRGTWSVHRLLLGRPNAGLIAFSSVNGQFGGYSAGAYAAANAFIDEIVEHHVRDLGRVAYSLGWSLWDSIGMSRRYALRDSAARRGYQAVSLQQGMVSFSAAVGGAPGRVLIGLDATNPNIRRYLDAATAESVVVYRDGEDASSASGSVSDEFGAAVRFSVRSMASRQPSSGAAVDASSADAAFGNEMERLIAAVWRESLSAAHIGPNDNFFDAGGTSLLVAATSRKLRQVLGRDVPMTDIYRFPTLRLLAAHYSGGEESEAAELSESEERGRARRAQRMRRRSRDS